MTSPHWMDVAEPGDTATLDGRLAVLLKSWWWADIEYQLNRIDQRRLRDRGIPTVDRRTEK